MRLVLASVCVLLFGEILIAQMASKPYTVSESDARQHLLQHEEAPYPSIAKAARVQGDVQIELVINEGGQVTSEKVVSGPAMLRQAALDAVKKWRFTPFLLDGVAIQTATTLTIPFGTVEQNNVVQVYNPVEKEMGPGSITQLPVGIRQDLVKRECTVPMYKGATSVEDGSFTKGHFRSNRSMNYAVVCDIPARKIQNVLVYSNKSDAWTGEVIAHGIFDPAPDVGKCEARVGVASPKYILDHARAYAPEELKQLPKLDHQGVNIDICEKASVVHYFDQGKWIHLQGAD